MKNIEKMTKLNDMVMAKVAGDNDNRTVVDAFADWLLSPTEDALNKVVSDDRPLPFSQDRRENKAPFGMNGNLYALIRKTKVPSNYSYPEPPDYLFCWANKNPSNLILRNPIQCPVTCQSYRSVFEKRSQACKILFMQAV